MRGWFPEELWQAYFSLKRSELEFVADMTLDEKIAAYRNVY